MPGRAPATEGENADLRRTLALYEEAMRRPTLENDALRGGGTVLPLATRSRPAPS